MAGSEAELWGVVLAAGESRRFLEAADRDSDRSYPRTLKQLQPFAGEPPGQTAWLRAAIGAGLGGVIVVGGCRVDEVRRAVEGLEIHFVDNPRFLEGRSSSVRAAVESLPATARERCSYPATNRS